MEIDSIVAENCNDDSAQAVPAPSIANKSSGGSGSGKSIAESMVFEASAGGDSGQEGGTPNP